MKKQTLAAFTIGAVTVPVVTALLATGVFASSPTQSAPSHQPTMAGTQATDAQDVKGTVDTPEQGDTPDIAGAADTPETGDTSDIAGAKDVQDEQETPVDPSLAKITAGTAEQTALKAHPGQLRETKLETDDGPLVYSVMILSGIKQYEVRVDAVSGKVLSEKLDEADYHNDMNEKDGNEQAGTENPNN